MPLIAAFVGVGGAGGATVESGQMREDLSLAVTAEHSCSRVPREDRQLGATRLLLISRASAVDAASVVHPLA